VGQVNASPEGEDSDLGWYPYVYQGVGWEHLDCRTQPIVCGPVHLELPLMLLFVIAELCHVYYPNLAQHRLNYQVADSQVAYLTLDDFVGWA
jgi:hypothetical protein